MVVPELSVREEPTTSARRLATVEKGVVFVLGGYAPVAADGVVWWLASEVTNAVDGKLPALPKSPEAWAGVRGYIPVSRAGTLYVEALASRCPATIDLANIVGMLPSERTACFRDRSIALVGTITCGECESSGPPETFEPEWLADARVGPDLTVTGTGTLVGLRLHFPPQLARDDLDGLFLETGVRFGSILRIVGHANDSRSATCEIKLYVSESQTEAVAPHHAEQVCRQHFVVESYEILGTDPAYVPPFG